jgi:hypothetical protein
MIRLDNLSYGVHAALRQLQVMLIDRIIALEHRHGFMPGDLHRYQGVPASTPQVGRRGVPEVMKDHMNSA